MHEQRLQIVPALGSPSAAPYPRPLLSRDTPGPGDRQQMKPGLLSPQRFLYTAPSCPPARFGHASFPSGASGSQVAHSGGRGSSQRFDRSGLVRPSPAWVLARVHWGEGRLSGLNRATCSSRPGSATQICSRLTSHRLGTAVPPGAPERVSAPSITVKPCDRLHLVLSKDFSPPRLREIEPTAKKSLITIYGLAIVLARLSFFPPQLL